MGHMAGREHRSGAAVALLAAGCTAGRRFWPSRRCPPSRSSRASSHPALADVQAGVGMVTGGKAGGAGPPDVSARAEAAVPGGGVGSALVRRVETLAELGGGRPWGNFSELDETGELLGVLKERLAEAVCAKIRPARLVECQGLEHVKHLSFGNLNTGGHAQLVELVVEIKDNAHLARAGLARATMVGCCALASIGLPLHCRLHDRV